MEGERGQWRRWKGKEERETGREGEGEREGKVRKW